MKRAHTHGSILVSLLWVIAILALMVVGSLYTVQMEIQVVKNDTDAIQARYLARAGVEKAKALLYRESRNRQRNHTGDLYDDPDAFKDVELGRGRFRVFRQADRNESGGIVYGIRDEESRLNINHADRDQLERLPSISPETAAAIVDYRDQDANITPGGAEADSYAGHQPPYLPRNGPFRTPRELLSVFNLSRRQFLGEDHNQNGLLDPEENDGSESPPSDNQDGLLNAGWSGMVTVQSGITNVNVRGEARVDIQSADQQTLAEVEGISSDLAQAIVRYRNEEELESLADLLDVRQIEDNDRGDSRQRGGRGRGPPGRRGRSGRDDESSARPTGDTLISQSLLINIADDLTAGNNGIKQGSVNINTASAQVLECLPDIDPQIAQAIVAYRSSSGYFPNIAALLNVSNIDQNKLEELAPLLCARSETFRILSEGVITSTGIRERIEVIVQVRGSQVTTLSYREGL